MCCRVEAPLAPPPQPHSHRSPTPRPTVSRCTLSRPKETLDRPRVFADPYGRGALVSGWRIRPGKPPKATTKWIHVGDRLQEVPLEDERLHDIAVQAVGWVAPGTVLDAEPGAVPGHASSSATPAHAHASPLAPVRIDAVLGATGLGLWRLALPLDRQNLQLEHMANLPVMGIDVSEAEVVRVIAEAPTHASGSWRMVAVQAAPQRVFTWAGEGDIRSLLRPPGSSMELNCPFEQPGFGSRDFTAMGWLPGNTPRGAAPVLHKAQKECAALAAELGERAAANAAKMWDVRLPAAHEGVLIVPTDNADLLRVHLRESTAKRAGSLTFRTYRRGLQHAERPTAAGQVGRVQPMGLADPMFMARAAKQGKPLSHVVSGLPCFDNATDVDPAGWVGPSWALSPLIAVPALENTLVLVHATAMVGVSLVTGTPVWVWHLPGAHMDQLAGAAACDTGAGPVIAWRAKELFLIQEQSFTPLAWRLAYAAGLMLCNYAGALEGTESLSRLSADRSHIIEECFRHAASLPLLPTAAHEVRQQLADVLLRLGKLQQAAREYAHTGANFEDVALALLQGEHSSGALRVFLSEKLQALPEKAELLPQRQLLATWILELLCGALSAAVTAAAAPGPLPSWGLLADVSADSAPAARAESGRAAADQMATARADLSTFLRTHAGLLHARATYSTLAAYGCPEQQLEYAASKPDRSTSDVRRMVALYLGAGDATAALQVLPPSVPDLWYDYAGPLLLAQPEGTVQAWLRMPALVPTQLLPALLQYVHVRHVAARAADEFAEPAAQAAIAAAAEQSKLDSPVAGPEDVLPPRGLLSEVKPRAADETHTDVDSAVLEVVRVRTGAQRVSARVWQGPNAAMEYLRVAAADCAHAGVQELLCSLYVEAWSSAEPDSAESAAALDDLLMFLEADNVAGVPVVPAGLSARVALGLCEEAGCAAACILLHRALGQWQDAIDLALQDGLPAALAIMPDETAVRTARRHAGVDHSSGLDTHVAFEDDSAEIDTLIRELWLHCARQQLEQGEKLASVLDMCEKSRRLVVADVLPLVPDDAPVKSFDSAVRTELVKHSEKVQQLRASVDALTARSERVRTQVASLRERWALVSPRAKCPLSGLQLLGGPMYVFPTGNAYAASAVTALVLPHLSESDKDKVIAAQADVAMATQQLESCQRAYHSPERAAREAEGLIDAKAGMSDEHLALESMSSAALSKRVAAAAAEASAAQSRLDELVAGDDPLCGKIIIDLLDVELGQGAGEEAWVGLDV